MDVAWCKRAFKKRGETRVRGYESARVKTAPLGWPPGKSTRSHSSSTLVGREPSKLPRDLSRSIPDKDDDVAVD